MVFNMFARALKTFWRFLRHLLGRGGTRPAQNFGGLLAETLRCAVHRAPEVWSTHMDSAATVAENPWYHKTSGVNFSAAPDVRPRCSGIPSKDAATGLTAAKSVLNFSIIT